MTPLDETRQLSLGFPQPDLSLPDLAVSQANRAAVVTLMRWRDWRQPAICLIGPAGSGLTTAARAWAGDTRGRYYKACQFDEVQGLDIQALAAERIAIDRADMVKSEQNLLFLMNSLQRLNGRLLLTGQSTPGTWNVASPDLRSRLKGTPLLQFAPPDEDLTRQRLRAAFRRRYLKLPERVENFLLKRIDLDYAAIEDFAALTAETSAGREISVPLVQKVLVRLDRNLTLFDGETSDER